MSTTSAKRTRLRILLAILVLTPLLTDVTLSILIRDGMFQGRPLPPFGAMTAPHHHAWLAKQQAELAVGEEIRRGFDPELGWTNVPGSVVPDGVINSIGARGSREYEPTKPADTLRLACFGDSFTFCSFVADEESWEAQLERLDPSIEALNFGVPGYGTDQALLRFRRRGRDLDADFALMGLYTENIGRNVNRYRPMWYTRTGQPCAKPRFVLDGDELRLIPHPFETRREFIEAVADGSVVPRIREHEYWWEDEPGGLAGISSLSRLYAAKRAYDRRSTRALYRDPTSEPFRVTVALLERFYHEARAAGAREAAVILYPMRQELVGMIERGDRFWETLLFELDRRGVPVIDLPEALAGALESGEVAQSGELYQSGHLSPAGNAVAARTVRDWVSARR